MNIFDMDFFIYQNWQRNLPTEADFWNSWELLSSPINYYAAMLKTLIFSC